MKQISNFMVALLLLLSTVNCKEDKDDTVREISILAFLVSNSNSVSGQVAPPTFNPDEGIFSETPINLAISSATNGASIYYTTDGSDPTTSSNLYKSLIHIWALTGKTIKAIAISDGNEKSDISTLNGVFSLPPVKTGQTTVFLAGDNGTHQSGVERGYTENSNGTVTDNATGLVWQKCTKGSTSDTDCIVVGESDRGTWSDAANYCSGLSLAGQANWRLPSRQELETLPDFGKAASPAIDTAFFSETVGGGYWSATSYALNTESAWSLNFNDGHVSHSAKSNLFYVRCVSGMLRDYTGNFTDVGDGTVKDNSTGLVWQKCTVGSSSATDCNGGTGQLWTDARNMCNNLNLAGKTWRLPTINELKTLINSVKESAATIDTTAFPQTLTQNYWSSTTYAQNTTRAWYANFQNGSVDKFSKNGSGDEYVRCVSLQ